MLTIRGLVLSDHPIDIKSLITASADKINYCFFIELIKWMNVSNDCY